GDAEIVLAPQHTPASSLERLRANLFSPQSLAPATFDDSVAFFSAPGEGREAVEITRVILDHARRGVPFDEMAIFLRSPAKYQAHLESAFDRAGIPAYFARGSRRPDPCGRALLALLACAAERLSARRFAEYLSLGQVPDANDEGEPPEPLLPTDRWVPPEEELARLAADPSHPPDEAPESRGAGAPPPPGPPATSGTLRAPRRWERLLVESAVIGGLDRWETRLAALDNKLSL